MNKLDIFCFTSVARTKSFSLTARELRISQQAVSKHIRNMEDELGYQLFFRDSFPVELTKAGSYMLKYFTLRKDIVEQINSDIKKNSTHLSMNIGFSQWVGNPRWFLELVKKYHEPHPEIEFHLLNLDSSELLHAASEHEVDLLITSSYMTRYLPPAWRFIPVSQLPLFIIKKYSTYIHDKLSLYPFYAVDAGESNDDAIRLRVLNTCRKLGFIPQNIITCNDMGTVMLNTFLTEGITIGAYPPERGIGKEYMFEKTSLSVDLMMCVPYQPTASCTLDFVSFITSQIGETDHE